MAAVASTGIGFTLVETTHTGADLASHARTLLAVPAAVMPTVRGGFSGWARGRVPDDHAAAAAASSSARGGPAGARSSPLRAYLTGSRTSRPT
ncbi:hypothetical protein GCM10010466_11320 [Planomonospora alba]|uniref:Uncharacterized protein n=1 Tax=Planomonospora alba TaxID=161354 RepID=A0ABP6MSG2_9ACTN